MRDGFDDFVRSRSTGLLWHGMPEAYARRALVNRAANRRRRRARRPEAPLGSHDVTAPDHSEHVSPRCCRPRPTRSR